MKKYWKQVTLPLMAGAAVLLLAACGNSGQTSQSASSSQSQAAVSSSAGTISASSSSSASAVSEEASSSAAEETSDLDGTYKASSEGEELTLVLSGQDGTLTTREADGEQEVEQVRIDPTNQTMVIGDDLLRYRIDGVQLTLEDLDQELYERETLVFTKQ